MSVEDGISWKDVNRNASLIALEKENEALRGRIKALLWALGQLQQIATTALELPPVEENDD